MELENIEMVKNIQLNSNLFLLAICLPVTIACIDIMAVAVGLAKIMTDLSATISSTQWLISGYTVGTASFLILFGRLADLYGRKRLLLLGILVFAIASLIGVLSSQIYVLIFGRFMQGVASSAMMTAVISLITHEFEPKERGVMLSRWGMSLGLGMAIGPFIGGLLIHLAGFGE